MFLGAGKSANTFFMLRPQVKNLEGEKKNHNTQWHSNHHPEWYLKVREALSFP
jgi:hypothetical protein